MEWLTDNAWLGWLGVTLVLAAIEAATVDFVFLMFAGGALCATVAAALGAPFFFQVVVAVIGATVLLLVVRPMLKRKFTDSEVEHRIGAAGLVGREAWVLQAVTDTDGRVKLAGETWSARLAEGGVPVEPGDQVRVIAIHGATAIVAPAPTTTPTP
ncbi:NfeD family protein [Phycicoccus duodecadis]|uniref:Membrane protein implicated in regulation of membrane protease activity n=1 Tax=Phycicoccus duodecadis TaxID=173053 RepID=A0A2N3YEM3_9MICO|nr:NfeD family protein [Phycicoccus duodecadis]PKW25297.1 membrane protein implicated in regulation of membrane protease activity [Phycicoccus duodecadis]